MKAATLIGNFKPALYISVEVSITSCYAYIPKNVKVYFSYEKIFEFLFTHRLFSCGRPENNVTGISEISFQDKSLSMNKITNKFKSQHDILHFLITSCKKLIYVVVVKSLHTAAEPAVQSAVKILVSQRNDTIKAFFFAANKNKNSAQVPLASTSS